MQNDKYADLKNNAVDDLSKLLGVKVSPRTHKQIVDFCVKRDWNMSKFIRRALDDQMALVMKEGR